MKEQPSVLTAIGKIIKKILKFTSISIISIIVIAECFVCGCIIYGTIWSYFHSPSSPVHNPAPSLIPHVTQGNIIFIIDIGMPLLITAVLIKFAHEFCHYIFRNRK